MIKYVENREKESIFTTSIRMLNKYGKQYEKKILGQAISDAKQQ